MNCSACKLLEARMEAIEKTQNSVAELVGLLEDVKSALRIFVKIGNAVKWLSALVLACSGITWAIKHFGGGI